MTISLKWPFLFERAQVTTVILLVYSAILIATVTTHEHLPSPPSSALTKPSLGLNLSQAWEDLTIIASSPHPFNSRQNDAVHDYLLKRISTVSEDAQYVTVDDDWRTNVTLVTPGLLSANHGHKILKHVESRNILVKIEGVEPDVKGLLLSAHYDSSAIAPGATDNGMSVVALLQLVAYFSQHQPSRTLVLNFNNGEEDGLHGSQTFLQHPWKDLVDSFINLEGAGAGGRAALFRTSSPALTSAFSAAPHPHGSILFSDVFKMGVIRSTTDFVVYNNASLTGVDYAFYTGRSKYHTINDSISSLGGKSALWGMVENLHHTVRTYLKEAGDHREREEQVVYFDIFGEALMVLKLNLWLVLNIVLAAISPVLIGTLVALLWKQKKLHWGRRGWGRLPLAICISTLGTFGLVLLLNTANGEGVYRNYYSVLISLASTSTTLLLAPLFMSDWWAPVQNQRSQILFETYVIWWNFSIIDIVLIAKYEIAGLYFITFLHVGSALASALALLDMLRLVPEPYTRANVEEAQEPSVTDENNVPETSANETTPLIPRAEDLIAPKNFGENSLSFVWILEFLLAAPFPAILLTQTLFSAASSLSGTISDGSKPIIVYSILAVVTFWIFLPLAAYAHRLPLVLYGVLVFISIIATMWNLMASPFSAEVTFKSWFYQTIDLDRGNNTVTLHGLPKFLGLVLKDVPSFKSAGASIHWDTSHIPHLTKVGWPGLDPQVSRTNSSDWVALKVDVSSPTTARFSISGLDTRYCRLAFNTDSTGQKKVKRVNIQGSHEGWLDLADQDLNTIELWSRDWEKTWTVDVEWDNKPSGGISGRSTMKSGGNMSQPITGKASCFWSEWNEARIPAVDELLVFMPNWATLTAPAGGLVEGYKSFEI